MKPIYVPKGKAKEYGDYAINIYTGCPHRCYYCFAPSVLRKDREAFHSNVEPRKGIVEAVKRQLDKEQIAGKLIHLCFTCDPYPANIDTTPTRQIIEAIKSAGANVRILTKGGRRATQDFDLLDENDWFGVTLTGDDRSEPGAEREPYRVQSLLAAHDAGINTWVSYEPVLNAERVKNYIAMLPVDSIKIGKLNYATSDIDWYKFGHECERLCQKHRRDYYIKDSLRREMNRV